MNKAEQLMSDFENLSYIYDDQMPDKQAGLYINGNVYLNAKKPIAEINSALSEELGHYLTSAGDIVAQNTIEKRKQEKKARDVGSTLAVTPDDLVKCYDNGCENVPSCASFLDVTVETFKNAIDYYKRRFGGVLTKEKDVIVFNSNGTMSVFKRNEV